MPTVIFGFIMLFLAAMWFTFTAMLFGPLDIHHEIKRLETRRMAGRLAVVFGFLFWIGTLWGLLADGNWPSKDFERQVFIENDIAMINAPGWATDFKPSRINLNREFNKQFQDGDTVKVKVYDPNFMWLDSGHVYEVNGLYIGGIND